MTNSAVTTRTYSSIKKDHTLKTLFVSESFLKKANRYGSKEAKALEKEMKKYPSYKIETKVAETKRTYEGLTIEKMATWLFDNAQIDDLKTLQSIINDAKALNRNSYPIAKKWFLENFGEEFGAKKAEKFDINSFISKVAA